MGDNSGGDAHILRILHTHGSTVGAEVRDY